MNRFSMQQRQWMAATAMVMMPMTTTAGAKRNCKIRNCGNLSSPLLHHHHEMRWHATIAISMKTIANEKIKLQLCLQINIEKNIITLFFSVKFSEWIRVSVCERFTAHFVLFFNFNAFNLLFVSIFFANAFFINAHFMKKDFKLYGIHSDTIEYFLKNNSIY